MECAEVWEADDHEGVLRLAGLQALASEVLLAKRVLRHWGAERQRQAAMWTLQAMNECAPGLLCCCGRCAAPPMPLPLDPCMSSPHPAMLLLPQQLICIAIEMHAVNAGGASWRQRPT